jgi:hypothetical protein
MIDFLRIRVLWANGSRSGARIAELIFGHFDGLGMERDGVSYRVLVRGTTTGARCRLIY